MSTIPFSLFLLALSLFAPLPRCQAAESVTARFLNKYSLTSIASTIQQQETDSFDTSKFFPFFLSVIEQENDSFFGYHATTASHLIFHETVKITLEELYGYRFPKDFYFLRAPDPTAYSITSRDGFIQKYSRPELSLEDKQKFVNFFFLKPIERMSQLSFPSDTIEQRILEDIYQTLLFYSPGEPVLGKSLEQVQHQLTLFITKYLSGRTEEGRVRSALAEWFKNPLQVERTDQEDVFLYPILHPIDDTAKAQQSILVSLNISLFSNYTLPSESTAHVFARGESIDLRESAVRKKTKKFFNLIGIDEAIADQIYLFAKDLLNMQQGILLQFFDNSKDSAPLSQINQAAYVCATYGQPDLSITVSQAIPNFLSMKCIEFENLILHPQLRLICIPATTLNPFSWLTIKEYDQLQPRDKDQLREFIRIKILQAKRDHVKNEAYRRYLKSIWN